MQKVQYSITCEISAAELKLNEIPAISNAFISISVNFCLS